ncbi:MAG TPA: hypothetical protein VMS56_08460 [Thermoanaerobaculia bacterium]|nr:hypothetical protein [Thermoanaerobaculia bacterium]
MSETDLRIEGAASRMSAVRAVAELMQALRVDLAFVGEVALAAWMGEGLGESGAVDFLALVPTDRSGQIPKMAAHRGFRIDEGEAREAEELDLLPMRWTGEGAEVRVHVLFATNALYGRMVRDSVDARAGEGRVRVVGAEDLALLVMVGDAPGAGELVSRLRARAGSRFDRDRLNRKLVSIGLPGKVLA